MRKKKFCFLKIQKLSKFNVNYKKRILCEKNLNNF